MVSIAGIPEYIPYELRLMPEMTILDAGYRDFVGFETLVDFGLVEDHPPYVVQIYFPNRPTSPGSACQDAPSEGSKPADERVVPPRGGC